MNMPLLPRQPKPPLVTVGEVAAHFQICTQSVRNWTRAGVLPPPVRLNPRYVRWDREALNAWLRERGLPEIV